MSKETELCWSPVTSTGPDTSGDALDAATRQFVLWCLEALGLHATADSQDVYRIEVAGDTASSTGVPLHPYADFERRRFAFAPAGGLTDEASADVEHVTLQSPLTRWLFEELRRVAWPMQAAAAHQPISVHELTAPLFAQYSIEGGHIHLSGCSLEDRPFLRLSFLQAHVAAGEPQVVHCFGTGDGELLDPRHDR